LIQVVLDANVLVSGLISRKGPPGQILDAWLAGKFQLFISPQILEEMRRVLSDNIYLACAVEAKAGYLVTGNSEHFEEAGKIYMGVNIITPRSFLETLEAV
jgi:predicted nucleic acid-binding protein